MVRQAALRTKGSGGPCGVDANGFRRILACKSFKQSATKLCDAIATMTKSLCTKYIPLDKGEGAGSLPDNSNLRHQYIQEFGALVYHWRQRDNFCRRNNARRPACYGHIRFKHATADPKFAGGIQYQKVDKWVGEVTKLAEFALSQPQACYAEYTFGLKHRYTYFLRTLPDIQDLLEPLENAISNVLIPAITDHRCNPLERDVLALPVRLGGLSMTNPCLEADIELSSSVKDTAPLVQQIVVQSHQLPDDSVVKPLQQAVKSERAEPVLQDITGEQLGRGSNTAPDTRLDIHARGFWEPQRAAFFDVRVCHPNAGSYRDLELHQIYRNRENEKKRLYSRRVLEVEQGTFTPLVFTSTGGMGKECLRFHSRLTELLAVKKGEQYSDTISWIRARVSFAVLRSVLERVKGKKLQIRFEEH
ncbi:predicted protein [Nematostella vectensis]|uniref:Uncharacterized protein n=1 Tax=Nematostella vectensis TaxID=45351 RepID=A7SWP4_NEMVE|nr:predicted protein [Nematostella vectensis]|eukprot:XP_001623981.1 predicted protein [Nematostella vectensis]